MEYDLKGSARGHSEILYLQGLRPGLGHIGQGFLLPGIKDSTAKETEGQNRVISTQIW